MWGCFPNQNPIKVPEKGFCLAFEAQYALVNRSQDKIAYCNKIGNWVRWVLHKVKVNPSVNKEKDILEVLVPPIYEKTKSILDQWGNEKKEIYFEKMYAFKYEYVKTKLFKNLSQRILDNKEIAEVDYFISNPQTHWLLSGIMDTLHDAVITNLMISIKVNRLNEKGLKYFSRGRYATLLSSSFDDHVKRLDCVKIIGAELEKFSLRCCYERLSRLITRSPQSTMHESSNEKQKADEKVEFKWLIDGSAKSVYTNPNDPRYAYLIPKESLLISKESELRKEVETANAIRENLYQDDLEALEEQDIPIKILNEVVDYIEAKQNLANVDVRQMAEELKIPLSAIMLFLNLINRGKHLAIDLTEVEESERIQGKYTVRMAKAYCDLEKVEWLPFKARCRWCLEFFIGLNDFHKKGYVHGDLKPPNIFIHVGYDKDRNPVTSVKIADYGKSKPMTGNDNDWYSGNQYFAPPENQLSQKGEIYSAGLLAIRILEGYFGDNIHVERFVTDRCLQRKYNLPPLRILKAVWDNNIITRPSNKQKEDAEKAIHEYIEVLIEDLKKKENIGLDAWQLDQIKWLLQRMTSSNPSKRPTMDCIVKEFGLFINIKKYMHTWVHDVFKPYLEEIPQAILASENKITNINERLKQLKRDLENSLARFGLSKFDPKKLIESIKQIEKALSDSEDLNEKLVQSHHKSLCLVQEEINLTMEIIEIKKTFLKGVNREIYKLSEKMKEKQNEISRLEQGIASSKKGSVLVNVWNTIESIIPVGLSKALIEKNISQLKEQIQYHKQIKNKTKEELKNIEKELEELREKESSNIAQKKQQETRIIEEIKEKIQVVKKEKKLEEIKIKKLLIRKRKLASMVPTQLKKAEFVRNFANQALSDISHYLKCDMPSEKYVGMIKPYLDFIKMYDESIENINELCKKDLESNRDQEKISK